MPTVDGATGLEIVNTSVVVLAQDHNPTILHPSFLKAQKIVPDEWESEETICTPPLSLVRFKNGLVFTVEQQKLQLTDNRPPKDMSSSEAPIIVAKYIKTLPHVRYSAVGLNIHAFIACKNPESLIVDKFIKNGPWNDDHLQPEGLGLRLVYPVKSVILRLSIDPGKIRRPSNSPEREGIILNANYHKDLSGKDPVSAAEEALSFYPKHCEHFYHIIGTIF